MSAARSRVARGFSLLEVVVALAILGVSLMAVFSINSGAIANHVYTKKVTVAALLARSKMIDIEQELYDKGFPTDDDEESGDFSDEGWPNFKWRAKIVAPKTQGIPPEQLLGALFNLPAGGGKEGGDLASLASLLSGGDPKSAGKNDPTQGLAASLGPFAGMMQTQINQMLEQITKSVREVHLTVTWKDGKNTESIDLVTHVVSLGPGSDRNGGGPAALQAAATTAPGQPPGGPWVRQDNGTPVPNPVPGPTGGLVDPADGRTPVIPLAQWLAQTGQLGAPGVSPTLPPGLSQGSLPQLLQRNLPQIGRQRFRPEVSE